jgi:hypothetical protein
VKVWAVLSYVGCGCSGGGEVLALYPSEMAAEEHVARVTAERLAAYEVWCLAHYPPPAVRPSWVHFEADVWVDGPFDFEAACETTQEKQ